MCNHGVRLFVFPFPALNLVVNSSYMWYRRKISNCLRSKSLVRKYWGVFAPFLQLTKEMLEHDESSDMFLWLASWPVVQELAASKTVFPGQQTVLQHGDMERVRAMRGSWRHLQEEGPGLPEIRNTRQKSKGCKALFHQFLMNHRILKACSNEQRQL